MSGPLHDGPLHSGPLHAGSVEFVSDADDPRIAIYRMLNDPARRSKIAGTDGVVMVEGRLAVERLVESDLEIVSLLVDDRQPAVSAALVSAVVGRGAPVYAAEPGVVAATVGFSLHRGIVAAARRPQPADPVAVLGHAARSVAGVGTPPLVVVVEGLNDHENLGALFRNAAAFGVAAVLADPTCADPYYRRSIRVSMGHALHVPFARIEDWPGGLDMVRDAGFRVVALAPHPDQPTVSLSELAARRRRDALPVALLVGAEGPGLSPAALGAADEVVSIAMAGGVDSLNVATAAAVAFHALST